MRVSSHSRCKIAYLQKHILLQSTSDVYGIPREPLTDENPLDKADQMIGNLVGKSTNRSLASTSVYLPDCGQVVRTLPTWKVPEGVIARGTKFRLGDGHIF